MIQITISDDVLDYLISCLEGSISHHQERIYNHKFHPDRLPGSIRRAPSESREDLRKKDLVETQEYLRFYQDALQNILKQLHISSVGSTIDEEADFLVGEI